MTGSDVHSGALTRLDTLAARRWAVVTRAAFAARRAEIDALNVFPVPDGDTGTNLYLTFDAALDAARREYEQAAAVDGPAAENAPPDDLATEAAAFARALLLTARGNSGVILSQIFRGFADEAVATGVTALDARGLAAAMRRADTLAWSSVERPVEGTILSVSRAATDAAAAAAAALDTAPDTASDTALDEALDEALQETGDRAGDAGGSSLRQVAVAALDAARAALAATPTQLPRLAQAGVVDAGGAGYVLLLEALERVVAGDLPGFSEGLLGDADPDWELGRSGAADVLRRRPDWTQPPVDPESPGADLEPGGPAYEVMYLLSDTTDEAVAVLRRQLDALGESLLVVGTGDLHNVHVHVDDVGAAIEAGLAAGRPHRIRVNHFGEQRTARARPPAGQDRQAVVACAAGEGLAATLRTAGAWVVASIPRRRATTGQLLDAARASGAASVILLPNDGDTLLAAHAAARVAAEEGLDLRVVPARTAVQGIAALAVFDQDCPLGDNVLAMSSAAAATRNGAVSVATTQALTSGGLCRPGDVLGIVDRDIVLVGDDLARVGVQVVERLLSSGGELLTIVSGADAPATLGDEVAAGVRAARRDLEVTKVYGGQPLYPLLLGGRVTVLLTEDSPVVKIAGPTAAPLLTKNKGIRTVGDLLEYVPRGYVATNTLTDMSTLREGQTVLVVAQVAEAVTRPMRRNPRQKMLTATLTDGQHRIDVTFFKAWGHEAKLVPGAVGIFVGQVSLFNKRWQLTHPEYELLGYAGDGWSADSAGSRLDAYRDHRIPVYSETGKVSSLTIRRMVEHAFHDVEEIREPLPATVRERRGLLGRREALELVHGPRLVDDPEVGVDRLRYDEAFVLQTILAQRRAAVEALEAVPRTPRPGGLLEAFDARLPFALTAGQVAVGEVLTAELARSRPMHRLLQGEVGSGKTVVALRAMLAVIDAGGQAALLAPTEVLAAQHHRSITAMLGDLALGGLLGGADVGTRVVLLTGGLSAAARRSALNDAVTGDAGIVVGTHALIQEHVAFHDLALVVVDEQHRFGVEQRDALREKGRTPPHVLVMTATPIPRTVAMTVFGDMETSTLRELPAGRSPIRTHVVDTSRPSWVDRTWERVAEEVAKGQQAYVVCPKIGDPADPDTVDAELEVLEDENDEAEAPRELVGVYPMAERLRTSPALAGLRVEVLHGRLDPEVKDRTMRAFAAGQIDVLVSTTVVEVGVDVPNASVMVVMDADRFGISQLHQLRGRVGRGSVPGLCLLMTEAPEGVPARERLDAVAATTDGFVLARRDLELRREGDVLGARQSGRASSVRFLRMANPHDADIIAAAREDATELVAADPTLAGHPELGARVAARLDEEQAAYLERG